MNHDKFGVFVIRDNGSGDASLPFFAYTSAVAVRQFAHTLRTLPPSVRADFELLVIGSYDQSNFKLTDNGFELTDNAVSIAVGSDEGIQKMIENDQRFYERVNVDQLPTNNGEINNEN